jgi:hypothetical protein
LEKSNGSKPGSEEQWRAGILLNGINGHSKEGISRISKTIHNRIGERLRSVRLENILIGAIVLRIELLRIVLANTQCAGLTWEPLVPFAFACLERLSETGDHRVETYEQNQRRWRTAYVGISGILGVAGIAAIATTQEPKSTFICAATLHNHWLIPIFQRVGSVLDAVVAYCVTNRVFEKSEASLDRGSKEPSTLVARLFSLLVVSIISHVNRSDANHPRS